MTGVDGLMQAVQTKLNFQTVRYFPTDDAARKPIDDGNQVGPSGNQFYVSNINAPDLV